MLMKKQVREKFEAMFSDVSSIEGDLAIAGMSQRDISKTLRLQMGK